MLEDLVRLFWPSRWTHKDLLTTAVEYRNGLGRIDAPGTDPWTNALG